MTRSIFSVPRSSFLVFRFPFPVHCWFSLILKLGEYILLLFVGWAEITKTNKLSLERIHFLSSFLPSLTQSSQSYLTFSFNRDPHAIEKCSIVKTISIITW